MDRERWQQIENVYHEALQRKPHERAPFLDEVCGSDSALRREVESLLAYQKEAEDFIETPAMVTAARDLARKEPGALAGTSFGPYRLVSLLGAGGMGEVYKARDTRLNRFVAVKVLPEHIDERPGFKQRFEREAQTIAALNHPNICVIHDVGNQDGLNYLVMELIEGETLAARLAKGKLPAAEVIRFAIEICDGLDKVHRKGVVHRDLKPRNIMLTRSALKLLDFGLAKVLSNEVLEAPSTANDITAEGTILGTVQYMAPEQVEGKEADARSDIFSVGVIMYEMLTGRKAFEGRSQAGVIAAILDREPDPIPTLNDRKTRGLDYVLRRCIAKNTDDRWQTAHDLLLQLRWLAQETGEVAPIPEPARSRTPRRAGLVLDVLAVILVSVLLVVLWYQKPVEQQLMRFAIYPPENRVFKSQGTISPDGRTLAFVADDEKSGSLIWLRSIDNMRARPLPGTEEAVQPLFWSPDSKYIAFGTATHLKKIAISEGPPRTLAEVRGISGAWNGGAWSADGTIVFGPGPDQPLFRIPAEGGVAVPVTVLDKGREEVEHVWPYFLPDGKHFLYVARSRNAEKTGVYADQIGSHNPKRVLDGNTYAAYAPPGYLLFVRREDLLAQPFNAARLELTGDPVTVAAGLVGIGSYSVSQNGILTFFGSPNESSTQLTWFNRRGEQLGVLGPQEKVFTPDLSPDGAEVAVERHIDVVGRQSADVGYIWLSETARDRFVRFTLDGPHDQTPVWSRDGKFLAFTTLVPSSNGWAIRRRSRDAQGEAEVLATLTNETYTTDWSPDGQFIAYESFNQQTRWNCWLLPVAGEHKPIPLLNTPFNERHVQFSTDGRWIAYTSNESGRDEVYVQAYPTAGTASRISSNGGTEPRWRRDGRELFYLSPDRKIMSVQIRMSPRFEAASPAELFQVRVEEPLAATNYDVSPDGLRFLVNRLVGERTAEQISVVVNWAPAPK